MLQQPLAHPRLKSHVEPRLCPKASLLKQIRPTGSLMDSTLNQHAAVQDLSRFQQNHGRTALQQQKRLPNFEAISNASRMLKPSKDRRSGGRRRQHSCWMGPPQGQWWGLLRGAAGDRPPSSILSGCKEGSQCSCLSRRTGGALLRCCMAHCFSHAASTSHP